MRRRSEKPPRRLPTRPRRPRATRRRRPETAPMRKQIDLPEVLDTAAGTLRGSIYKCMPGIVQAYYPGSPPTVDVQPAVNDVRFDTTLVTRISEPWPVL